MSSPPGATGLLCARCITSDDEVPELPEYAWATGELRNALDHRDMGKVIRGFRRHPQHGRVLLQSEMAKWLSISQGHLSRLERGDSPLTNIATLSTIARTLRIPPPLLWFVLDDEPVSSTPTPQPDAARSSLPEGLALAIAAPTELALADALLASLSGYSTTDMLEGPHSLIPIVQRQIGFIHQRTLTAHGQGLDRLHYVQGRYAEFMSWLQQDAGDLTTAKRWSAAAVELAGDSHHQQFAAYSLMRHANIATDSGDLTSAADYTGQALQYADVLTSQQRAVVLRQHAHTHAARAARSQQRNDILACIDAMARAADAAAQPCDHADDLARYVTPAYIGMEAGVSWLEMGHPEKALAILERRMADWGSGSRRDLGMGLARLATAYAGVGEPAQALEIAEHAVTIARETGSARTRAQLRKARTALESVGTRSAADELASMLRNAQRPTHVPSDL